MTTEKGIVSAEDDGGIPSDILQRLKSSDASEREAALGEVVRVGGDDAFRCISRAFDDETVEVRNAAAIALFDLQPDRAATFTRALREGTPERRRNIGHALAASGLAKDAIRNLTGDSRILGEVPVGRRGLVCKQVNETKMPKQKQACQPIGSTCLFS